MRTERVELWSEGARLRGWLHRPDRPRERSPFIVQGPGYVMVEYEWGSSARIIPLDGRPHLSPNVRPWSGNARGRWEGNTLVVETKNFRPEAAYQDANPRTLRIIERFTRTDPETIEYKYTIDDPTTWTKPWRDRTDEQG